MSHPDQGNLIVISVQKSVKLGLWVRNFLNQLN